MMTPQEYDLATSQRAVLSLFYSQSAAVNHQNFLSSKGCNDCIVSPIAAQIVSTPWSPHLFRGSCVNLRIQAVNRRACKASSYVGNGVSRKCSVMDSSLGTITGRFGVDQGRARGWGST
jgi:hypothetical protein